MKLKSKILGHLAYAITGLLQLSLRKVIVNAPEYNAEQPYLFAFWHGKQLLPVWQLRQHQTKRVVLVSASKDGDILTVCLKNLQYETIRGSSRHHNISALAAMIRKLKQGYSLGFGVDGPIGPIYTVKPGMTHMAQKLQIPIIPVGSAFSRKWVFEKAWDKYEIPKPLSKAVLYLDKPYYVPLGADLEACNRQLEGLIKDAEAKALALL